MLWMLVMTAIAGPVVIAHRGYPSQLPDHTLAGYERAVLAGADFIEPDLVSTKDGILVARHENEIGGTTDVADAFPDRQTTKIVEGRTITGWFTEDFTLAELKTLRARQPLDFRPADHDGRYEVPTLDEILTLITRLEVATGRTIGIYPETKHPTYFAELGLPLERPLVDALHAHGLTGPDAPVFLQSFEVDNLKAMAQITQLPRIQLIDDPATSPWDQRGHQTYGQMLTEEGLTHISEYAQGIGVHKSHLIPLDPHGNLGEPNGVTEAAHARGLQVHVYTFRPEDRYLPRDQQGNPAGELRAFYALGVDGVFSDDSALALSVRDEPDRQPGGPNK